MKFLRWDLDKWNSTNGSIIKYDKLEHLILAYIGLSLTILVFYIYQLMSIYNNLLISLIIWETIGIAWEIKDGVIPYDDQGHIEGFSFKDLIANNFGFILAIITVLISLRIFTGAV